jgi:allophanate hydrolase subunit 1
MKSKTDILKTLCAQVLCIALAGCSAFQPATQNVTVATTVPGATIKANGVRVGESPVTFKAKRNQDLNLVATKTGYEHSAMVISRQTSSTFMLDLVGGFFFLVPFIGVLTPGAYELSSTQVEMPLQRER